MAGPRRPDALPYNLLKAVAPRHSKAWWRVVAWGQGAAMGGNFFFPLSEARSSMGSPMAPLWLWRLWRQDPGLQGGDGAWLRPGPQLSDALPQVKGKFKHGGCEALVNEVPGQTALEICVKNPDEGADTGITG